MPRRTNQAAVILGDGSNAPQHPVTAGLIYSRLHPVCARIIAIASISVTKQRVSAACESCLRQAASIDLASLRTLKRPKGRDTEMLSWR
jgi:hypothetical protein